MLRYLITWVAVAAVFLAIDAVWLAYVAKGFYQKHLSGLLREEFLMAPAALFYLFYAFCLVVLVIVPAVRMASPWQAVLLGALLGLCAYGTLRHDQPCNDQGMAGHRLGHRHGLGRKHHRLRLLDRIPRHEPHTGLRRPLASQPRRVLSGAE